MANIILELWTNLYKSKIIPKYKHWQTQEITLLYIKFQNLWIKVYHWKQRQARDWGKIFANSILGKELVSRILLKKTIAIVLVDHKELEGWRRMVTRKSREELCGWAAQNKQLVQIFIFYVNAYPRTSPAADMTCFMHVN